MSAVKKIKVENRLAKLAQTPGGVTLAEALKRADRNLDTVREDYLNVLDEQIGRIERLSAGDRPEPHVVDELYACSNELLAVAGVFGLGELGEAAYSFCELLDRLRRTNAWSRQSVAVHVNTMKLLRHPERTASLGGCRAVLDGLREVTNRTVPSVHSGA